MTEPPDPTLRALAHPVRLRMLSQMWSAEQSAAGLSRALGISHALASQHLRTLADAGLVELTEVRARRGGRERLFRTVRGRHLSDRDEGVPLIAAAMAANLRDRAQRRTSGDGLTVDADLWVRPDVWHRFVAELTKLTDRLHEDAASPTADGVIPVAATIMAFQVTPSG